MRQKLLIVDDEPGIVDMMVSYFSSQYEVLAAYGGNDALQKLARQPDLILLDINMPDMDGLEVCEMIRDRVSCPILFLTARIEDRDKVKGFFAGGDDYILKPFSLMELEARVCAHLRREARHKADTRLRFVGNLAIDFAKRQLFCGKEEILLTKKEFDIVELLSQNPGQVFDKERIYEKVWGYDSEAEINVVWAYISYLRRKLESAGANIRISTRRGQGYVLEEFS